MIGASITEPFAGGVAEHHRRTEELLEGLDGFYESSSTRLSPSQVVAARRR